MTEREIAGWNHRVMRHRMKNPLYHKVKHSKGLSEYTEWFSIHEVYFDNNGEPVSWTSEPADLFETSIEELRWTLQKMLEALNKPVLEYGEEKNALQLLTEQSQELDMGY